jgi:hypothetical protein
MHFDVLQKMKQRLASVWIAVGAAAAVSILCYLLAGEAGRPIQARGGDLPLISKAFYPEAILIYLYPVPLAIWSLIHSVRRPDDRDQGLLIVTTTLSISIVFVAMFALALALPYIPGAPSVLQ